MPKIGLTGSIAVGKSFVCEVFRELGAFVLDADQTAREVVAKDTIGLKKILENFGEDVLQPDGALDRAKLARIVFADEAKRQLLNSIVHPLVIEAQNDWLLAREREDPGAVAIVDAALMIESGSYTRFDTLIVVWCEIAIQLHRLIERSDLSKQEAQRRIDSQMPQEEKKRFADFLIDTSDGFEAARKQTIDVFNQLKRLNSPRGK